VFNATFSNISAISWRPVLVVEEAGVPGENQRYHERIYILSFVVNEIFCINIQIIFSLECYLIYYVNITTGFCYCYFFM